MSGIEEGQKVVLRSSQGDCIFVDIKSGSRKISGLGVIDTLAMLGNSQYGDVFKLGTREFTILKPRLAELVNSMKRGAQTISAKDAGFIIAKSGIGADDVVVEAGLGSGGLSMHILRVLGDEGLLISVENRQKHADTGLENIQNAIESWGSKTEHRCIIGDISEVADQIPENVDAIILDLPDHVSAIKALSSKLKVGGRIACYCPVSSQMEDAWQAVESSGLVVDWAGELMQRQWGRASKGGMRPVNGPFGHTAFLLIALKA